MEWLCERIFKVANRIVTACRSAKELEALRISFRRHFDEVELNKTKAVEYERIIDSKDRLYAAVGAVKGEARAAKEELNRAMLQIEELKCDNQKLRAKIAMFCELHANGKHAELDRALTSESKQYLPSGRGRDIV